ncbi:hypothetical protein O7635_30845 [Asanoa sp. WMMD1127]|uniref:hypothetical protein n=1 Tax=Asanoa sp. WMMD1127 TaxID=3016107 RepID=UPI0024171600|nr:hypothetical protein [Asanoa sp. WMMD1127]MDG4826270.1 hypothetical protein [Asanoa sp. WMMD1127]
MVDAHPQEALVDLDRPPPQRPLVEPGDRLRAGWRRLRNARLQAGAVVLAAVVGAVAGGVGVHRWEARQRLAAETGTVELSAQLTDPGNLDASADGVNASIVTNLTLVNLGPLPIQVLDLDAARDGLELRNAAENATVRPGFRTVAVWLTFACVHRDISTDPLPLHVRVRTQDGRTRAVETTMEIGRAQWPALLESRCAGR